MIVKLSFLFPNSLLDAINGSDAMRTYLRYYWPSRAGHNLLEELAVSSPRIRSIRASEGRRVRTRVCRHGTKRPEAKHT